MPSVLRWLALLAFVLAIVAAVPVLGRLGRIPWLAIGLLLWLLSEMVRLGDVAEAD